MTDNRTTELLPCPFCGGEAEMLTAESMHGGNLYGVMCNCCAGRTDVFDTEAEAIAAWNARAERGTLTAEQVRETVEKHWHDLSADYDMPEATALPEYSYDWQAIADELNARAERTCEEIVRCRDCKHHESQGVSYSDKPLSVCTAEWCEGSEHDNPLVEPNGFCAWGERK